MSARVILPAIIVGVATVASTLLWYRQQPLSAVIESPVTAPTHDVRSQQARELNQQLRATPAVELSNPGPLPASLQGAEHGVTLLADAQGNLLVQADILHLFDFYLAGLEEESLDKVLTRIHQALAAQLHGPALEQARDLLRRYVDYRLALQGLPEATAELEASTLRLRLEAINGARQQFFKPQEYAVLFARENAEDLYMVQRLALVQQDGLSDIEQQQALAELELQLPEDVRQARADSMRYGELYTATQALQAQGASSEDIRQLREQSLGSEAADALAELDRQQAAWQQRLSDYASERNRLREAGLTPTELQAAVSQLQVTHFDELERKRVQALDAEL